MLPRRRSLALVLVWALCACGRVGYGALGAADGGADGAVTPSDGGPGVDGGPEGDAGPVVDGGPEADGGPEVDGGGVDGGACAGCFVGAECLEGTVATACGSGGAECVMCPAGSACVERACAGRTRGQLALGFGWSCAVVGPEAYCWGSNFGGTLGDGTTTSRNMAGPPVSLPASPEAIAAGDEFTCALLVTGLVACWGSPYSSTPEVLPGAEGIAEISVGEQHVCARLSSGGVKCVGANFNGQLGDGTTTSSPTPVDVMGLAPADEITAGWSHTCARAGGEVYCWGDNSSGQLGDGTMTSSSTPVRVEGVTDATQIAAGYRHTCAVRSTSGRVHCWGVPYGPLPSAVEMSDGIGGLSAGYDFTCGIRAGVPLCWGINGLGQLGDGTTTDRPSPVRVESLTGAVEIETGNQHTCARRGPDDIWCWGDGLGGELGNGFSMGSTTPVQVVFP